MASLVSVNVGTPRQLSVRRGRPMMSAIVKEPVDGRVRVEGVNLAGDDQADRRVHGGPDKAVYAYAREDIDWWEEQLGARARSTGMFGENLTTDGRRRQRRADRRALADRHRGARGLPAAAAVLQARAALRRPADGQALRPGAAGPGAYLRIVTEGELGVGDEVDRRARAPTTASRSRWSPTRSFEDRSLARAWSSAPELAEDLAAGTSASGGLTRGARPRAGRRGR